MKTPKIEYTTTMRAIRSADCYSGPTCDRIYPQWKISAAGDRSEEETDVPIRLLSQLFPAGTKVTVEVPVCPKCGDNSIDCLAIQALPRHPTLTVKGVPKIFEPRCDFDWDKWTREQFS